MLQRIQTVYLFIVAALGLALFFLPLANMQAGADLFTFDIFGLNAGVNAQSEQVYRTWSLAVLIGISTLLPFITIFLYKKRRLQIRFCIFNAILLICFYLLFGFFVWITYGKYSATHFGIEIALAFPLVNLILTYLAIRNIGADEALVRSLERLR